MKALVRLALGLIVFASCGADPDGTTGSGEAPDGASAGGATGSGGALVVGLPDMTQRAGIDFRHTTGARGKKYLFETMGSGVALADFDGDERPDILFLQSGTLPPDEFRPKQYQRARHKTDTTAKLFLNRTSRESPAAWAFEDATEGSGFDEAFYAMGLAVGDIDADGDRDVYVAAYGLDRLFVNDGHAVFEQLANERGVVDKRWTIGGAFFDVDLDGDLDLYSLGFIDMPLGKHQFCGSKQNPSYCHVDAWEGIDDRLWINDGRGYFWDGTAAAGLKNTRGRGLALAGADWDDDSDTDLFVANDSMQNLVLRNAGGGRFTDVSGMSGAGLNERGRSEACMGSDIGDLDGDGDLDLFVVNFQQETNTFYRNDGGGFFSDVTNASGLAAPSRPRLGFGTVFVDIENDGDLDIYVTNGHVIDNIADQSPGTTHAQTDQLFLNDGQGRFREADPGLGPSLSLPRVGRGVARGDLDGDGDDDLVVTNSDDVPWVLRNDLSTGHRIVLRLLGPEGRADAEGARVELEVGGRKLLRELVAGGSYQSHSHTDLIVGLGDATQVERLSIRWPGGERSEHGPLDADKLYVFGFGGTLEGSRPLATPSGR